MMQSSRGLSTPHQKQLFEVVEIFKMHIQLNISSFTSSQYKLSRMTPSWINFATVHPSLNGTLIHLNGDHPAYHSNSVLVSLDTILETQALMPCLISSFFAPSLSRSHRPTAFNHPHFPLPNTSTTNHLPTVNFNSQ